MPFMTDDIRFDGRVAVITEAGNGMGRAYAHYLAARGANEPAQRVVEEIREAGAKRFRILATSPIRKRCAVWRGWRSTAT